jgi:hypothetical protein
MNRESMQMSTGKSGLTTFVKPDSRDATAQLAGRLELSLMLFHDGVAVKRANLERSFPTDSPEEIEVRLRDWLLDRPHDQPGVPAPWPRR